MNITITKDGAKTYARLSGRLDTTNAQMFQDDIAPLMEDPSPDFEFDCSEMDYTSSQGLRIFLMLQKSVSSKGGKMVLKNMQSRVKEVFDITGFSNIIKIV